MSDIIDSAFISVVKLIICVAYFSTYECPIIGGVQVLIAYSSDRVVTPMSNVLSYSWTPVVTNWHKSAFDFD